MLGGFDRRVKDIRSRTFERAAPVAQDSTLQSLINRMNSGDPAAKALLLAQTYERLRRLARKMLRQDFLRLKEREDTDDVLQNAAIRLNRAMQAVTLRDARQFFRLAATTIRRELLDLARHYGRTHAKDHPQRASAARQRAAVPSHRRRGAKKSAGLPRR